MVHGKKKRRDAAQPGAKKKALVERKSTVAMETGTERPRQLRLEVNHVMVIDRW